MLQDVGWEAVLESWLRRVPTSDLRVFVHDVISQYFSVAVTVLDAVRAASLKQSSQVAAAAAQEHVDIASCHRVNEVQLLNCVLNVLYACLGCDGAIAALTSIGRLTVEKYVLFAVAWGVGGGLSDVGVLLRPLVVLHALFVSFLSTRTHTCEL